MAKNMFPAGNTRLLPKKSCYHITIDCLKIANLLTGRQHVISLLQHSLTCYFNVISHRNLDSCLCKQWISNLKSNKFCEFFIHWPTSIFNNSLNICNGSDAHTVLHLPRPPKALSIFPVAKKKDRGLHVQTEKELFHYRGKINFAFLSSIPRPPEFRQWTGRNIQCPHDVI